MRPHARACVKAAVLVIAPAGSGLAQRITAFRGNGEISGTVLGPDSRPFPGAKVMADPIGISFAGAMPWADTDAHHGSRVSAIPGCFNRPRLPEDR